MCAVYFLLCIEADSEPKWKSTTWEEIRLGESQGVFLSVMPIAEGALNDCELFLSKEWWSETHRPSSRYVHGRMKLSPEKKDFYRKKVKEHSDLFACRNPEQIKVEMFPFVSEIWVNSPKHLCILIYSHDIVALTNAPWLFMEDSFSNERIESPPYVYFYFSPHQIFCRSSRK